MQYLLDPHIWRKWWKPPPLSFWITPSGTKVRSIRTYVLESPASAHALEAIIGFGVGWLITRQLGMAMMISVMLAFKGQTQKLDADARQHEYNIRNVVWRTVYVAGVCALMVGIL